MHTTHLFKAIHVNCHRLGHKLGSCQDVAATKLRFVQEEPHWSCVVLMWWTNLNSPLCVTSILCNVFIPKQFPDKLLKCWSQNSKNCLLICLIEQVLCFPSVSLCFDDSNNRISFVKKSIVLKLVVILFGHYCGFFIFFLVAALYTFDGFIFAERVCFKDSCLL